jgi:ketosteroid isomerase-like protein
MPRTENEELIQAYFRMVEEDDYAAIGSLLTDDATWTIVPIGYTWRGRGAIESMAVASGRTRRHDERSQVEITNWFTDEQLCVEYKHKLVVQRLGLRLTIDGYCLVFHMRDGRFDTVREYINPSNIAAGLMVYVLLRLLPYVSKP